jgi:hypothetical protein
MDQVPHGSLSSLPSRRRQQRPAVQAARLANVLGHDVVRAFVGMTRVLFPLKGAPV